jgi:ArsR family metal-binding transcriptional regulator
MIIRVGQSDREQVRVDLMNVYLKLAVSDIEKGCRTCRTQSLKVAWIVRLVRLEEIMSAINSRTQKVIKRTGYMEVSDTSDQSDKKVMNYERVS